MDGEEIADPDPEQGQEELKGAIGGMEVHKRKREFSMKGLQHEIDILTDNFDKLRKHSQNILELMKGDATYEQIKAKFSLYMDKYEQYIERHQNFMARVPEGEKEAYVNVFEERDKFLDEFKKSIEHYFKTSQRNESRTSSSRSSSHHSSRSESSRHSSYMSSISSKRLAEEQRKVELEQKKEALQKKKKLELAKVQLQIEEEELNLTTEIAVSDAKSKVLEKYEQFEHSKSEQVESGIQQGEAFVPPIIKPTQTLNPEAKPFHVENPVKENRDSIPSDINTRLPVSNRRNFVTFQDDIQFENEGQETDSHDSHDSTSHESGLINSNTETMQAIVRNLRKPVPDIQKFGGDPLNFRKFVRQFNAKVVQNCENEDEKMNYLEQFTFGEAHKVVTGFSHMIDDYAYKIAMQQLEERYGSSDIIASAFIKKALDWPVVKSNDAKALDELSLFLIECENAAYSIDALKTLEYSENIKRLMCKLPFHLHDRWRNIVFRMQANKQSIRFSHFVEFVQGEAKKMNDFTYGTKAISSKATKDDYHDKSKGQGQKKSFRTNSVFATDIDRSKGNVDSSKVECSYCKKTNHTLEKCLAILKLDHQKRYEHLKSHALCFGCLKKGHMTRKCRTRLTCNVCNKKHPTILHDDAKSEKKGSESENITTESGVCSISDVNCQQGAGNNTSCAMAIIPVKVKMANKDKVIETYAFFDIGSSASFCTEDIMRQLGGSGKCVQLSMNTMADSCKLRTFAFNGLQVCDMDMNSVIDLPTVYSKEEMPVSSSHIPTNEEIVQWSHLNHIKYHNLDSKVGILIGNNVPDAYTPFEVATGPKGTPHATRSRLGWIVWNLIRNCTDDTACAVVNRAQIEAIHEIEDRNNLDYLVRKSMNVDFPELLVNDKKENSIEDNYFMEQVNDSIEFKDGHYHVDLPFRNQDVKLPNNISQGFQRLKGLKSKLLKNEKFKDDYVAFMDNIIAKQYAEKVPENELRQDDGRVWYITHHGIYHPKKPNKIRVVFDCSASYMGISLNGLLLQGPDLANNLLGVLFRFRSGKVALIGDIESMFYQVKVPPKDRNLLRFLWWPDGDVNIKPEEYRMTVHIFGATSSPSVCNFALNHTANEHGEQFESRATETIKENMYVDDCLVSTESDEEAINLVRDIRSLCDKGGFNLTKWMSTSQIVFNSIPEEHRTKEMKQWNFDGDCPAERALGVFWYVDSDSFGFQIQIKSQPQTKRGILSVVSAIYDPIGIVSPFVLLGRSLLQRLCLQGLGWDDEISQNDQKYWNNWLSQITELQDIKIARCYKPQDFEKIVSTQIHCFSDASNVGYGVVFYIRLVDVDGKIHCSFLLGKSRVAPLKMITVPRMELTAAARAVRLSNVILKEIGLEIDRVFFWTDSMTVLRYIRNRSARYQTFVANRIALIHEATENEQWNYVNTKQNPADFASRGMTIHKFQQHPEWISGPDFLWFPQTEWPQEVIDYSAPVDDLEIKKVVNIAVENTTSDVIDTLIGHYSDYNRLKRAVAWILKGKKNLRRIVQRNHDIVREQKETGNYSDEIVKKRHERLNASKHLINFTHLSINDLRNAELALIHFEQRKSFDEEFLKLESRKEVKRSSVVFKLDPFVDSSGTLRVGGRLSRSELENESKHPIILSKTSLLSHLIISNIHRQVGHLGKNTILTKLREKFWILGASYIIKKMISKCVICRKYQAPVMRQKMADLPVDRVTSDTAPFTMVGIDYFGPFEIKQRRVVVKRYGVIFTCLKVRAIHLEIAHSLDTDSCINATRRFISRRGVPKLIRSDNGTNLVAAERELREEIQKFNKDKLDNFMLERNIDWEFNPPAGSNFGGVWERLIRSVRKVFYSVLRENNVKLDDECLQTLFCEIEAILNNRPITEISDSVTDLKVLTPNDILLLRSGENCPPGLFVKTDCYAKRRWRHVQYLADLFWSRWTREYLPLLQQRVKWNKQERNVQKGDIVLLVDNTPRNSWAMGKIEEVIPDKSGIVRIAKVKTRSNVLTRPIGKLCLLLEADGDK